MKLTETHIEFISNSLEFHGLQTESIKEDIVDHICTTIENSTHIDFKLAYEEAIQKLGGYYNIKELQKETKQLLHGKTILKTQKAQYISGILMTIVFSLGLLFKMFQWPYANIGLLVGVSILLLVYIPLLFFLKHKKSILNYQS